MGIIITICPRGSNKVFNKVFINVLICIKIFKSYFFTEILFLQSKNVLLFFFLNQEQLKIIYQTQIESLEAQVISLRSVSTPAVKSV